MDMKCLNLMTIISKTVTVLPLSILENRNYIKFHFINEMFNMVSIRLKIDYYKSETCADLNQILLLLFVNGHSLLCCIFSVYDNKPFEKSVMAFVFIRTS